MVSGDDQQTQGTNYVLIQCRVIADEISRANAKPFAVRLEDKWWKYLLMLGSTGIYRQFGGGVLCPIYSSHSYTPPDISTGHPIQPSTA